MLSKLASYTLVGIDATPVEVEVDVSFSSMPKTVLVGLAETAVKESTHRVERAIVNSGYRRPIDRVVINLAPADLKKDAGGFDLPIALGLLAGQRAGLLRPAGLVRGRRRAGPDRRDPAHQGGAGHGLAGRRREARRPARPDGQRARGRRRRGAQRLPDRQPGRGGRLPLRPGRHGPAVGRSRRGLPPALAHGRRLRRRQGTGLRQAGSADRRGRQPQHPDDRPAGHRQDAAGQAAAHDPAPADPGREPGDHPHLQRDGSA